jgi:hypothetical protein
MSQTSVPAGPCRTSTHGCPPTADWLPQNASRHPTKFPRLTPITLATWLPTTPQRRRRCACNVFMQWEWCANATQRLKSALWYAIGQYVDEECLTTDLNATPQFIGALTELVYTQIGTPEPTSHFHPFPVPRSDSTHSEHIPRPRSLLQARRPQSHKHRRRHAPHKKERCARDDAEAGA